MTYRIKIPSFPLLLSRCEGRTLPGIIALMAGVTGVNLALWAVVLSRFADDPMLLGTALLAWTLGLRHGVDADHIAAIDNATRKLMQTGQRPVSVGLWFALGHSAIVVFAAIAIAAVAGASAGAHAAGRFGGVIATLVSTLFLIVIAIANLGVLRKLWRERHVLATSGAKGLARTEGLLAGRGLLVRVLRPVLGLVGRPWHMALLGFLFGLGFDTASEVAILGLSGRHAAQGLALDSLVMLPLLFAAGMALVDSADGAIMAGAYQWAFVRPWRKLSYNIVVTAISAVVALAIGAIQALALAADSFDLRGAPWRLAGTLSAHFNALGFAIVGLFVLCWVISYASSWRRRAGTGA